MHGARMLSQRSMASRARYLVAGLVPMTLAGAIAEIASDVSRGKDPRKPDEKFWLDAMVRGGGLGALGDYLFSDVNRFGDNLVESLAGPVVATASAGFKATVGNLRELIAKVSEHVGQEMRRFLEGLTPGASLWYARLAIERLLADQLEELADPDAPARFRRMERRARQDFDQRYWWRPGHVAPDRVPRMGH